MQHHAGAEHRQGGEIVHIEITDQFGIVLDIGPGEHDGGPPIGQALQHRAEFAAGAAPFGAQGDDLEWRVVGRRLRGKALDRGEAGGCRVHRSGLAGRARGSGRGNFQHAAFGDAEFGLDQQRVGGAAEAAGIRDVIADHVPRHAPDANSSADAEAGVDRVTDRARGGVKGSACGSGIAPAFEYGE
jgi:hypothetical protein